MHVGAWTNRSGVLMGAWGTALFSDDVACDVRADLRERLADGVDDDAAIRATLGKYSEVIAASDDGPVVILALAVTASKLGRLTPDLRDRGLSMLDEGRGAERWEDDPKLLRRRIEVLSRVREQLVGPQPPPKKVRRPSRHVTSLQPGDVLAYEVEQGTFMAVRVVRIDENQHWVAPTVQILDWHGDRLPSVADLEDAPDMPTRPDPPPNPWRSTRSTRLGRRGHDFQDHGFVRCGSIAARAGDADSSTGGVGGWNNLESHLRLLGAAR
jgi:Domain of unknown function (DUF4259)